MKGMYSEDEIRTMIENENVLFTVLTNAPQLKWVSCLKKVDLKLFRKPVVRKST